LPAVKDFIGWRVLAAYSIEIHRRFKTPQTAIKTRNIFRENTISINELMGYVEMVNCHEIFCQNIIKHQASRNKTASGFFIHEYFSCDRREPNRVGRLFDAITLRVYKKITNKNTGKSRQHCAAFKHYCLRLLPDLFHQMRVGLFRFPASFCSIKARPK